MYIQVLGSYTRPPAVQNPLHSDIVVDIVFHEGPLHNVEFKGVSIDVLLGLLDGAKIPLSAEGLNNVTSDFYISLHGRGDEKTTAFLRELKRVIGQE